MSFGANNTTKAANNNLAGTSNLALNTQFPQVTAAGGNMLNLGNQNTAAGTNFFNTLANGNQAAQTSLLQPNIDQIRGDSANSLKALSTLMPRGGARSEALFSQALAPQQQIQNLFNPLRGQAAGALTQTGLQQSGQGANLFGLGNQALSAATGANSPLAQSGLQTQQMSNSLAGGLGGGLFNLLTTPLSGGASILGSLGGLFSSKPSTPGFGFGG